MTIEIPLAMVLVLPVSWVTSYLIWRKGAPLVSRWRAALWGTVGMLIYAVSCMVLVIVQALIST